MGHHEGAWLRGWLCECRLTGEWAVGLTLLGGHVDDGMACDAYTTTQGDKEIVGTLRGIDEFVNMVMDDVTE